MLLFTRQLFWFPAKYVPLKVQSLSRKESKETYTNRTCWQNVRMHCGCKWYLVNKRDKAALPHKGEGTHTHLTLPVTLFAMPTCNIKRYLCTSVCLALDPHPLLLLRLRLRKKAKIWQQQNAKAITCLTRPVPTVCLTFRLFASWCSCQVLKSVC